MTKDQDAPPVAFLDFDETVANTRALNALGDPCDPVSMALLHQLCADTGARIVVSSTWRSSPRRCAAAFDAHGLTPHLWSPVGRSPVGLHPDLIDDWCVDADNGSRSATITRWLANHPKVTRWAILDDSRSDLTPDQLGRLVHVDPVFGLDVRDVWRAKRILGFDAPDDRPFDRKAYPRYTLANLALQAKDALSQGDDAAAIALLDIIAGHPLAQ